jgi:diguanylate cyclase (GGDEF)-like protein
MNYPETRKSRRLEIAGLWAAVGLLGALVLGWVLRTASQDNVHRLETAAALAASVCVLFILFGLLRQFRAERYAQAALQRRNDELEVARQDLERRTNELEESARALRAGERLLAERSATLNTTLEHIIQGILMVDASGRVRVYNKRVMELLDLPEALLARSPLMIEVLQHQLIQGEFADSDRPVMEELIRTGRAADPRPIYQRVRPNGNVIEFSTIPLPGGGLVRTYTDITDLRRAQDQIERTALFDELTGLPNRLSVRRTLEHKLGQRGEGEAIALLYVNLDRFRLLNDARGHVVGDQILVEVARRLQSVARADDFVGRTGGDEFAIVHPLAAGGPPDALAAGQHLLRLLAESYLIDGRRIALTASIGVAIGTARSSPDVLLRNSEIAMYRAKDAGRNQICRYEAAMAAAQEEQFQLEQSLRESLGTAAFRLVYQPIVSLENDEITGFEALLRWTDRVRGEVSPGLFIPIAEATGLIVPLGRSVLEWACLEAASWSDPRTIAVNLSPAQFQGGALSEVVREMLTTSGLPPERLELEVTEGMLLEDTGAVHETMFALRDIGVSLTLDDFGTGHAGLSYLRRFPFSKIKIDRSFIRNLGTGGESDVIVEGMLSLGRRLGLRVVAEGVELESQLERLRALGCAYVQGFLTGRPVAPEVARHL